MKFLPVLISLTLSPSIVLANDWLEVNNLPGNVNIPSWTEKAYINNSVISRTTSDLYVNFSDWIAEQNLYVTKPTRVVLFADTLEIDENFNHLIDNQNILIFARRVIGHGTANFVLGKEGAVASFTIIADHVEPTINILAFRSNDTVSVDKLNDADTLGISVLTAGDTYRSVDITTNLNEYLLQHTASLVDIEGRIFDAASAVFDTNPVVAGKMIDWAERTLRLSDDALEKDPLLADLYLQAVAFQQFITLSAQSDQYVPRLDRTLYKDKYRAYLDAMVAYQAQWDLASDRQTKIEDKLDAAQRALDNVTDVLNAQQSIIDQSDKNVSKLHESLSALEKRYNTQELTALSARSNYVYGVEVWKTQQELNAALQIFQAIAELGSAISGVFTGNLGAVNDLTEQLSQTPETLSKAKNLVTNIKNVTGIIDNISKSIGGIAKLTNEAKGSIKIQKIAGALDTFNFALPTIEESNLAWDLMLAEVRSNLRFADSLGIKGARQYLLELEKQVLLGKGINTAQLNLAHEQAKMLDMLLTQEVSQNQQARLQQAITDYQQESGQFDTIEKELSRMLTHFKRPMFIALANYKQAYKYWALKESSLKPSLNKSALDYQSDLATIESEYLNALERFDPAPQDSLAVTDFIIDDQTQLQSLAEHGELNVQLALDNEKFCRYDRVRLSTLRVYLEGESLPYGQEFNLKLSNSGNYQDRFKDQQFAFSSTLLNRSFDYRLDDAQHNQTSIILDGAVANKLAYAYFEPTPFTTWNVKVADFGQADTQYLQNVERVRFEFLGSGIPGERNCNQ